jgi:large subunit ribosomal protein L18
MLVSRTPRLVVRMTNKKIITQLVDYAPQGDKVLLTVTSADLKKSGWNYSTKNIPAAYLTGMLLARRALAKKVNRAIADIGFHTPIKGARIYAVLKGAIDGKLDVPCDESVFPTPDRLKGEHIKKYVALVKDEKQFSRHQKEKIDVASIDKAFDDAKNKILRE